MSETIADIKAWLRRPIEGENAYLTLWRNEIADRIEASENQSVTNCNRLGNAAKMREAFANIAKYAKSAAWYTDDAHLLGYLNQIERCAESALSYTPRNCDVGTAEEQNNRFKRFCDSKSMGYCWGRGCRKCMAQWGQMPYEEGDNE